MNSLHSSLVTLLVPAVMLTGVAANQAWAQDKPPATKPFVAGQPLGVTLDGKYTPMSRNVKVYGAVVNAESCSYDAVRGLIVVPNRGADQSQIPNDGFVSLLNHDGSVHTVKWIGATRDGLTLNHPLGSDIVNGLLYVADIDGGTTATEPTVAVIRKFDMKTGAPAGELRVSQSPGINDIAVTADGTIYGTQTRVPAQKPDPGHSKVFRITAAGVVSELIVGPPLRAPNGIALDNDGNLVVVNIDNNEVLTFTLDGRLLKTEHAVQAGNDGLVIMKDGTKYVSSVRQGGVSRIRPGQPAELIASGIPNAASMCYDSGANQLVIPMNPNNGVAIIPLR
jgi:outer membrane protein assembly factor BamB